MEHSPIVDDPDHAYMSDAMRAAVRQVASCFQLPLLVEGTGKRYSNLLC